ncbi:Retrovirus-related Pol polyprotein from transposon TNT 1-94 [Dendrobium catenatum]|uniref:Retrovirus-related Pol polyprotein from transposon TNT 1-94 n=1 Tax=Dendrobium catenatum TaxID=906689 RepID=A0A2I0W258_9ASPA|nr:Retrovirus-related Pol polyprotein from transposon TNT 1-94 [Dendrobium catenatum]
MENSMTSQMGEHSADAENAGEMIIPSSLKFVMSNLKNIVPTQLSPENYSLWRSQIVKLLRANGFEQFLDPAFSPPDKQIRTSDESFVPNPKYTQWIHMDQNLAAAMCSTISQSILPYIIHLESTATIWTALETRFQSTNRSKVIQLKNELHNISMSTTTCQIYYKKGHSAANCWHRLNEQYVPRSNNRALTAAQSSSTTNWFLDSGATSHLTNSLDNLSVTNSYQGSDNVTIGDGRSIQIAHSGSGLLHTYSRKFNLAQLLHVPELKYNLLSISKLTKDNNISITFEPNEFVFKDLQTQQILLRGPCLDGLYLLRTQQSSATAAALKATTKGHISWHNRLGHPNSRTLELIKNCNSHLHIVSDFDICHSCNLAKAHKMPFEKSSNRRSTPLELVHSDVWGPAPVESTQGYKFYVLFVDDYTRFVCLFPMKQKSEVPNIFFNFKNYVEKLTSHQIKSLRTDGGTEYTNHQLTQFLKDNGILHQISCPYTPEQNGLAERKHRHIIETTRSLLFTADVPYKFWPDATITSVYLINHMPSPTTSNKSPFELLYNHHPDYSHLRTFGCACYPLIPSALRNKLQPKAHSCVFLGYSENYKGYKCLDISTNKLFMSRHLTFAENIFPFSTNKTSQPDHLHADNTNPALLQPTPNTLFHPHATNTSTICPSDQQGNQQENQVHFPNHSDAPSIIQPVAESPTHITKQAGHPMVTRRQTGKLKPVVKLNLLHTTLPSHQHKDPTNYTKASKHPEWRKAMAAEFFALQTQGTWSLVEPPKGINPLGCKWTFRTKYHSDGSIARYKARLVALGNHQEQGIDYNETFSPVAKLPTIRILLTVALHYNWSVQQLDVANAFLHGKLQELVYMMQPKGFEDATHPHQVCRLNKAIYGLRQAPRQWYTTFTTYLLSIGFSHSKSDPSLLLLKEKFATIYLIVYVDDILITGDNPVAIQRLLHQLNRQFSMKHLGEANMFLGIHITKHNSKYFLSQEKYAASILQQADMLKCNPLANPTVTKFPSAFSPNNVISDPAMYRKITGALQYLTLTRPDIAFSVNLLSQHMHDPSPQHQYLLKRQIRYLKGTLAYGLPITRNNLVLQSFSDADWAGDPISRKSTSGYCSFLGTTLISWTVKKQHTVARSSTESEYRSLAALTADIIWLKWILADFGIPSEQPTDLFCDNTSAIALANNPVFHARTKHIEIDQRFVRD